MRQISAKIIFAIIILCGFSVFAQNPIPTPIPTPRPLPLETIKQRDAGTAFKTGQIYYQQRKTAQYPMALENFQKAAKLYDEIGDKPNYAAALLAIGLTQNLLGNTIESIVAFQQSLNILRTLKNDKIDRKALGKLGLIYDELVGKAPFKRFDNDELTIQPPKKGYDQNNEKVDYRFSQTSLRYDLQYFNQPFVFHVAPYQPGADPLDDSRLAGYREYPEPVSFYDEVFGIWKLNGVESLEVATDVNLMEAWAKKNRQVAIFYGKQAINRYQEIRKNLQQTNRYRIRRYYNQLVDKFRFLADLLIANGQFAEAEQVLQMLKEEEFSDFIKRDANEIKNLNQRLTLNEKERELIKRYSELADKVAEIGQEFLKLDDKKRQLTKQNQSLSAEEQSRFNQLSAQIKDANDSFKLFVEKDLSKQLGATAAKNIDLDRQLQEKLRRRGDGTVALYTVVTADRYRIILTTPSVQIDGKTDIKLTELNKKVFAFLEALQNPKIDARQLGKELYDILLKPIEKELNASNAKTLVWSLDGVLRYIPLAALSPDGQTYLIEKYQNVLLTPKTRDDLPNSKTGWWALGMGVSESQSVVYPDYPDQKIVLSSLPSVKDELLAIIQDENNTAEKGIFKGRRYLNNEFTLKNLETSLAKRNPNGTKKFNVVHFASHFRLSDDWSESFLLLGNAKILTLENLSTSPTMNFDEVELVTLSACKTAISSEPDGKEVESLAGAIQSRGGRTVLATLWDVVDESTSQLMTNFYRLKKENPNLTKAEALQLAQKEMINGKSKIFAHPYYWSPFVIFGNWR